MKGSEREREEERGSLFAERSRRIRECVLERIDFSAEVSDERVLELIDEEITLFASEEEVLVSEMKKLRQEVFHSLRKLDILQDLVDDPSITEIMINGADSVFVERRGAVSQLPVRFGSEERLLDVVTRIVSSCNRVVSESSPIADARLPNGDRVNVVLAPTALNGPILTIRRFPEHPIEVKDLLGFGSMSRSVADFLGALVQAGYNIFISGGTGSGKTTFLNAMSSFIPKEERVITIEDNAELQIRHIPNLVRLEARNANVEGCVPISIRDLIRTSLRMRPDRIIVGEVRGGEAVDMIQAMNTGHDGSMSTGHSNNPTDMLHRLETMMMMGIDLPLTAIQRQIASALDIIIHLGRLRDKSRKVLEIVEVLGFENGRIQTQTLYEFREEGMRGGKIQGTLVKSAELVHRDKLLAAGYTA